MRILFGYFLVLFLSAQAAIAAQPKLTLAKSVVKVIARGSGGKNYMGSGIVIADNLVATNCHVIRKAGKISIMKLVKYPVIARSAIPELDVCLLQTRNMNLPAVPLGDAKAIETDDSIYIFGYPHAVGPSFLSGSVVALHLFAKSRVIEIDTGFMQGSSGGGLFNEKGELIGLTTFMGKRQKKTHFYAIPIDWIKDVMAKRRQSIEPFNELAFWEKGAFKHLLN